MPSFDDANTPLPPNAFDPRFLELFGQRDEPPTAGEADVAGPWRIEPTGEDFGLFRLGEVPGKHRPVAVFASPYLALLAAAVLPGIGRDQAFRLRQDPDLEGFGLESRGEWGALVGHLAAFDEKLLDALNVLHALITAPESLAFLLEAAGALALERAGTLLAWRISPPTEVGERPRPRPLSRSPGGGGSLSIATALALEDQEEVAEPGHKGAAG